MKINILIDKYFCVQISNYFLKRLSQVIKLIKVKYKFLTINKSIASRIILIIYYSELFTKQKNSGTVEINFE